MMNRKTVQLILWVADIVTSIAVRLKDTLKRRDKK